MVALSSLAVQPHPRFRKRIVGYTEDRTRLHFYLGVSGDKHEKTEIRLPNDRSFLVSILIDGPSGSGKSITTRILIENFFLEWKIFGERWRHPIIIFDSKTNYLGLDKPNRKHRDRYLLRAIHPKWDKFMSIPKDLIHVYMPAYCAPTDKRSVLKTMRQKWGAEGFWGVPWRHITDLAHLGTVLKVPETTLWAEDLRPTFEKCSLDPLMTLKGLIGVGGELHKAAKRIRNTASRNAALSFVERWRKNRFWFSETDKLAEHLEDPFSINVLTFVETPEKIYFNQLALLIALESLMATLQESKAETQPIIIIHDVLNFLGEDKPFRSQIVDALRRLIAGQARTLAHGYVVVLETQSLDLPKELGDYKKYCVVPETPVYLANGIVTTMGELYEKFNPKKPPKIISWRQPSAKNWNNVHGRTLRSEYITEMSEQIAPEVIEIKATLGRKLTGTPNHLLLVREGKKFVWKTLAEIRVGDRIAIPASIPTMRPSKSLKRIKLHKDLKRINGEIVYRPKNNAFAPHRIKAVTELTSDLAYLIGLILSDGHISVKNHYVRYSNEDSVERFVTLCKKIFNIPDDDFYVKRTVENRPNRFYPKIETNRVDVINTALGLFLESLGVPAGKKAATLRIPDVIMKSPPEQTEAFLKGYFEGDGCLSDNSITTFSKTAAIQLSYLFAKVGVITSLEEKDVVPSPAVPCCPNKKCYVVHICKCNSHHKNHRRIRRWLSTIRVIKKNIIVKPTRVIGCYVPKNNNLILGETPLISHNTIHLKLKWKSQSDALKKIAGFIGGICDIHDHFNNFHRPSVVVRPPLTSYTV